jgi:steroid delta-isomerase-like uncharacterized protein
MPQSPQEFVRNYIAAMNRHDVAAVLACYANDACYEDAAIGVVRRGHTEMEEFIAFFFRCYHNVTYTVHSVVGGEDRVGYEWTLEANYAQTSHTGIPATGQKISLRGASFMRLRDGLGVWNTDYWDIGTMRRQIESGGS